MNAKLQSGSRLMYDLGPRVAVEYTEHVERRITQLVDMLFRGGRGANLDDLRMDVQGERPIWLFVEGDFYKPGTQTWALEKPYKNISGHAPREKPLWAYADRPVIVLCWDAYFRLDHWPEGVFRLGTSSRKPLLKMTGDELRCAEQDVYYNEAELQEFADPFLFLKPEPSAEIAPVAR